METDFIGRNVIFLPEVQSTNSYAIDLLKNVKLSEGTVVYAHHQTEGKGQRGNSWKSDAVSNITLSVVLFPEFLSLQNQFYLYQIAALGCYDTIAELLNTGQFDIKIKWPNDILVNTQKITGILIENNLIENHINSSVIGIGMNVNQEKFENGIKATSLKCLMGSDFELNELMAKLFIHIEKYYLLLKANEYVHIQHLYLSRMFGKDRWMNFEKNGMRTQLKVKGLSTKGLLLLEDELSHEVEADVKELKWIY